MGTDARDGAGNRVACDSIAYRILDKQCLRLVKQNPSHTAVGWIAYIHAYGGQTVTKRERPLPDVGDAAVYCGVGQAAARERPVANAGNVSANGDVGQAIAVLKRSGSYGSDSV